MIRELKQKEIADCANILVSVFEKKLEPLAKKTARVKSFLEKALRISRAYKIVDIEKNKIRGIAIAEIINNEPYLKLAKLCIEEFGWKGFLKIMAMSIVSQLYSPRIPGPEAFLLVIGVKKGEQGKGIGTKLLKKMESDLIKQKVPQVGLFVRVDNPEAADFYARNGYYEVRKFGSIMGRYIYMRKEL